MKFDLMWSSHCEKWFGNLKERMTKIRILARLERIKQGNFGDHKRIDQDLSELRLDFGPGFRLYYSIRNKTIVLLLYGGDKGTQTRDIDKAKQILEGWNEHEHNL